uniref:Uncharacterized protein n=1 Tax=Chromera velia CCMP2878 TaxID=1169474 RepID=A0A0G4I6E8_9ALVE|eukprot:Cvel_11345.t1-p1 / transcript=Cvel_11345.t1 / gene=Cvel_11345 / organism=Chromera_velia_CCMP2878 / gene_product=hypothetical protein / transcript_product=hypothetical protein / location=Cvel_scaffold710:66010-68422(+) / protein_length=334 / sequence_SO=supercontig / SO=protein_coding / is_pseudo=false
MNVNERTLAAATSALKLLKSKEAMSDTPTEVGASLVVALEDVAEAAAQGDAEANAAIKDMRYSKQWVQEEDCNFPPEAANDIRRVTTFVFNDAEAAPATSVLQVLLSSELADTGATTFKLEPAQIDGETGEFILLKDDEEVVDLEDPDAGDQDFVLALATDFDIEKLKNQAAALFEGFKKFLEEKNKGQQLAKPPPMATTSATDSFKEPIDTATELQSRIKEKAGGLSTSTPTKDKDSTKTLETVPEEGVPSTPKEEEKEEKVPVTVEKEEEHMTGIDPSSIPPVEEPVPVPEPVLHEVPETPTENGSGEQDIETVRAGVDPSVDQQPSALILS